MKKGLTLTVVLLIVAAVLAVVGFMGKGDLQKKLDAAKAEVETKVKEVTDKAATEAKELTDKVASLTTELEAAKAAPAPEAPAVKHGLGIVTAIDRSSDATAEKAGTARVNTTICSLVLDAEGKIQSVTWDVAQTTVQFSAEGKPVLPTEELKSKLEIGEAYGMKARSEIGKEWNEQIEAFVQFAIGKTVEEVAGIKVFERDASHKAVPDVEELKASVTITVGDYIASLVKAAANAK